jgi:hypothetical protein
VGAFKRLRLLSNGFSDLFVAHPIWSIPILLYAQNHTDLITGRPSLSYHHLGLADVEAICDEQISNYLGCIFSKCLRISTLFYRRAAKALLHHSPSSRQSLYTWKTNLRWATTLANTLNFPASNTHFDYNELVRSCWRYFRLTGISLLKRQGTRQATQPVPDISSSWESSPKTKVVWAVRRQCHSARCRRSPPDPSPVQHLPR